MPDVFKLENPQSRTFYEMKKDDGTNAGYGILEPDEYMISGNTVITIDNFREFIEHLNSEGYDTQEIIDYAIITLREIPELEGEIPELHGSMQTSEEKAELETLNTNNDDVQ